MPTDDELRRQRARARAEEAERRRLINEEEAIRRLERRAANREQQEAQAERDAEIRRQAMANRERRGGHVAPRAPVGLTFADVMRNQAALRSNVYTPRPGVLPVPVIPAGQVAASQPNLATLRANRFPLNWEAATLWVLPDPVSGEATLVNIVDMPPELLYATIEWAVKSIPQLFMQYADDEWLDNTIKPMALLSKEWMATRTAFRALVQEAIKKQVAFSDTTYLFIKQFVVTAVHRKMQLQGSKPWADETRRAQQSDLQEFTNQPVQVVTDAEMTKEFGRKGRAIRLDD